MPGPSSSSSGMLYSMSPAYDLTPITERLVIPGEDASLPKIVIGNVNPGTVSTQYQQSMRELRAFDLVNGGQLEGVLERQSGANISKPRNQIAEAFLDDFPAADWLLFIDSDMVFSPDLMVRLTASARAASADVIGALTVMVGEEGAIPTLYVRDEIPGSDGFTRVTLDFATDRVQRVYATGTGCMMISRKILEQVRGASPYASLWPWFREEHVQNKEGNWSFLGEDINFCRLVNEVGGRIFVDARTHVGHVKNGRVWWPNDIREKRGFARPPITAVIPVKDREQDTMNLLHDLWGSRYDDIVIIDNGSEEDFAEYLEDLADLGLITLYQASGAGLHAMWNVGVEHALEAGSRTHIAFLNNDVRLCGDWLSIMSTALTDHPELMAVSGNYDNRDIFVIPDEGPGPGVPIASCLGQAVVLTDDICANRYDGTGGNAGFAFMVRSEWFVGGYRFPQDTPVGPDTWRWWYGDNDLFMSIAHARHSIGLEHSYRSGIVLAARCEHVNTEIGDHWRQPPLSDEVARDRVWFYVKWSQAMGAGVYSEQMDAMFPDLAREKKEIYATADRLIREV